MNAAARIDDFGLIETLLARDLPRQDVEATALRTRAPGMRAVLAYLASLGHSLEPGSLLAQNRERDRGATAALARVIALQTGDGSDLKLALEILQSLPFRDLSARHVHLLAQLLFVQGRYEECSAALAAASAKQRSSENAFLEMDLHNPWLRPGEVDEREWASRLANIFTEHGLEAVAVSPGGASPFDGLAAAAEPDAVGPLVTVVMTTFRPGPVLLTSVRSVLNQTWRNLELIVVDDASGPEHLAILDEVEAMDDRVRVVRRHENLGTYAARNRALELAKGEFVTGQDDDDWSHPRRIERQIEPLLADPGLGATRAMSLRTNEQLVATVLGHRAVGRLTPTYLVRRGDLKLAGGYVAARKGADTELVRRVEVVTGRPLLELDTPLAVYRLRPTSLSRSEFGPGWHHPARAAFWSSSHLEHDYIARGIHSVDQAVANIAVPERYAISPRADRHYELALVADWGSRDLRRRGTLDALIRAVATDRRVAIIQQTDPHNASREVLDLHPAVQAMVNRRTVDQVFLDDTAQIDTAVVLEPRVLQFPPHGERNIDVGKGYILADHAPHDPTLRKVSYVARDCAKGFTYDFGVDPIWVARDLVIRDVLAAALADGTVMEQVAPHSRDEVAPLPRPRGQAGPVIGRVAHTEADWPDDDQNLAAAFVDHGLEVRVLGSARAAARRLGRPWLPPGWVVFDPAEAELERFLGWFDFYVEFSGALGSPGRARAAALAAGRVVVLPRELEPTYADAAVYASPSEVAETVMDLWASPDRMSEQSARALRFAAHQRDGAAWLLRAT